MSGRLVAVCVGDITSAAWAGRLGRTAIDKQPQAGPVAIDALGLAGDAQADKQFHGGYDQAVYAYSETDADYWSEQVSRPLPPGQFGENLRIGGIDASQALIGQRLRINDVELEVSGPRIACRVFAGFWDRPGLVDEFNRALRLGAYLRVRTPGTVTASDPVVVTMTPDHEVTVAEVARVRMYAHQDHARLLPARDALAASLRSWLDIRSAS
ncbi:MAG: MOSC domain-containing protein [Nitriliruptoraceae bacterium]